MNLYPGARFETSNNALVSRIDPIVCWGAYLWMFRARVETSLR